MSDKKNLLEVVRIKDPNGTEYNATRAHAKNISATVLDKPVQDRYGRTPPQRPTPGKPRTDLAGQPTVTEKSTVTEIDAFAEANDIDLGDAQNKTEKLAAIDAATPKES